LAKWFGDDRIANDASWENALVGTAAIGEPVSFLVWPRLLVTAAASLIALGCGLLLLGARWTPARAGLAICLLGVVMFMAAMRPQPAGQLFAAAQPGLAALAIVTIASVMRQRRQKAKAVFKPYRHVVETPTAVFRSA
jgi:hypothetical protein